MGMLNENPFPSLSAYIGFNLVLLLWCKFLGLMKIVDLDREVI